MKKVISLIVLFAVMITTTLTPQKTYAATGKATYAKKVPAVALGVPYCFTLSIQDNKLVLSGSAPFYVADSSLKLEIIKPINYGTCTIASEGRALVGKDVSKAIKLVMDEIGPLDSIPGYTTLWEHGTLHKITSKRVENFVDALLERNPDLNRSRTTSLLYILRGFNVNLDSTKSITQGLLSRHKNLDLTYYIMNIMLSAAPTATTTVKSITHPLICADDMAPIISATDGSGKNVLTLDLPNVPKLDLDGIPEGVYNIRVGYTTSPMYSVYHDDILIVIKDGNATLQLLNPTYRESNRYDYPGYTLAHYYVRPAITHADYSLWSQGLPINGTDK